MAERFTNDDTIQVVMIGGFANQFETWLEQRRLMLTGPLPVDAGGDPDDLPTYIISPTQELWDEVAEQRKEKGQ